MTSRRKLLQRLTGYFFTASLSRLSADLPVGLSLVLVPVLAAMPSPLVLPCVVTRASV